MKKLLISVCALGFALCSNAQAVVDNAVIPVSVNINSIMRMNVVSGGNIEFAFNTIEQYTNGISNSPRYDTKFTVASSINFQVAMYTEDATLVGSDDAGNSMDPSLIGFEIESTGSVDPTECVDEWTGLDNANSDSYYIVKAAGGDINANAYTIHWSCGDDEEGASGSILEANLSPDRYSTNIFLVLSER